MSEIVVAGLTSMHVTVPVEGFPLEHERVVHPEWVRIGVSAGGCHIAKILQTLGDDVRLCTVVGVDLVGEAVRADLRAHSLYGPGVINVPESSLGVVLAAPDERRRAHAYRGTVDAVEYPVEVFRQQAKGAELAILTDAHFCRPLLEHATALGIPVAVDVHRITDLEDEWNRPWLEAAEVVFCSHEQLPCEPVEWVARVFKRYPRCGVVGIGRAERGCLVGLADGRLVQAEAVTPLGVVNTGGAGDSLFASFLHGWVATGDPVDSLRKAAVHVGWKIGHRLPEVARLTEEQLDRHVAEHPAKTTVGRWDRA
jgi:acarbose 7IV-phosphotransferase